MSCGTRVPPRRPVLFPYRAVTFYGRPFQTVQIRAGFVTPSRRWRAGKMDPQLRISNAARLTLIRFGLAPVRSPLLGGSRLIYFPPPTEMFQFSGLAAQLPMYSVAGSWIDSSRLPDSEILGSKPVSGSPGLIAAVHVLHRLSTPRHPPHALRSLTYP